MDKQEKQRLYKNMYKDVRREQYDKFTAGKKEALKFGITFSVFKDIASNMIVTSRKINYDFLFRTYCEMYFPGYSVEDFCNFFFNGHTMSETGIRLKSVPDDRL